ncbi:DNA recombination protein RmuC [uncultured Polaribacter sp.]|uniref:DNA recombination protein RmuC n=1 Tax=uncultured Polaribacter sp. TaxID=174711 RepID=UPI00259B49FC|nr:DNA recombination protein RmuC [uncultured Polaribacter sp.]
MEKYVYLIIGVIFGGVIIYLWLKQKFVAENTRLQSSKEQAEVNLKVNTEKLTQLEDDFNKLKKKYDDAVIKLSEQEVGISSQTKEIEKLEDNIKKHEKREEDSKEENKDLNEKLSQAKAFNKGLEATITKNQQTEKKLEATIEEVRKDLNKKTEEFNEINKQLASELADNKSLKKNLETQKKEIEDLGKKFNTEFENIATKILKANTESFSETNKEKLKTVLEPLGKNITEFKHKVEEVYEKEAKQRFSLGQKVADLVKLNEQISQDAINLTNALKGEAKTQGNWGEMILESILEKSGLRKDEEYFMEHQLLDDDGKPLRSDSEGKKMRPDAVIKYPDNRNVIIDSKVSLNAFTRYIASTEVTEQKRELEAHISAIKTHIVSLSTKGYDDYDKALDFVMMFIPSEPAYIAAMQGDADLWNFAYNKRILLMNPTNLITSLKLIVDLWKREYQNQNAIAIADRGAKLYDKFVGFVDNLEKVGKHIGNAQTSYDEAYKQLSTGNDNLVLQATKLKKLGVKNKKELSKALESDAGLNKLTE